MNAEKENTEIKYSTREDILSKIKEELDEGLFIKKGKGDIKEKTTKARKKAKPKTLADTLGIKTEKKEPRGWKRPERRKKPRG